MENHFYKAGSIPMVEKVNDQAIIIDMVLPDGISLQTANDVYDEEAEGIANILWDTLPGGVYDRLVINLMARKVSYLKYSFGGMR